MSNHLSEEQFAKCFVGASANEERQHLIECEECSAQLNAFGNTVSSFRHAILGRIDAHVESRPAVSIQPATLRMRKIRWALATAAVLVVGMVPLLMSKKPQAVTVISETSETSPETLMNAINAHLSRTVPAPMEPMMSLIPSDESRTE